ncbi:MAG: 1,4-alpha-glucan branching protein GlgB [Dehalococcoidia bacterium]
MSDKSVVPRKRMSAKKSSGTVAVAAPLWFTADDQFLFNSGEHFRLYDKLGAHPDTIDGRAGTRFAVWAPNADAVSLIGEFNGWDGSTHPLHPQGSSGIWEAFLPGITGPTLYKFAVTSQGGNFHAEKSDPFAFHCEIAPKSASVTWDMTYQWEDQDWMATRAASNSRSAPMSIYELHIGSWRRVLEEGNRSLSYRELAPQLAEHMTEMGFTHVEFMPVMEHPFFGSWGYQVTGYFAPSSAYGTPQDFMYLVDYLHQQGIGVILDWVPSHFPNDPHALAYFDGTHLYEHADPRQGFHPEWRSCIFNYGRHEVRSFLISNALFWLDKYHVDGLRVDGVASMLYLDYARNPGEWVPNEHGGRENLAAVTLLRRLNEEVYRSFPDVQTIAEESTSWPAVSRPTYVGGLGFGLKWDMGWMHDVLDYMSKDPLYRSYHHNRLTFRSLYAFHENFVLPLSHDEVVYGKGSLLGKMPGDEWQQFANLRLLLGFMYATPGKKLLFMGAELAQRSEWQHDGALDWPLLQHAPHAGMKRWLADLNDYYRGEPALYERDHDPSGFEWIDADDSAASALSFLRKGASQGSTVLVVCNFTPVVRQNYRVGVPVGGFWREAMNSDATVYYGSGQGNMGGVEATPVSAHGRPYSLNLTLPPLAILILDSARRPG